MNCDDFALEFSLIEEINEIMINKACFGPSEIENLATQPILQLGYYHRVAFENTGTLSTSDGDIGLVQFLEVGGCVLILKLHGEELLLSIPLVLQRVHERTRQGLLDQAFQLCRCC